MFVTLFRLVPMCEGLTFVFYWSGSSMQNYGSTPDKIKFIDGSRETLKLAVRITDLWFVGTPNKSEQAEMVIVDSNGDEIHVVCKTDRLKSWKADLKENCTYVMHNFKVMKNDGQFRVYEHQYKLVFTGVSVVRQSNLDHLPFKEFKFVEFSNVIASDFEAGLLVGSYPPSVSNSLKASKLLINEPVLEIQEFSERKTDIEATPFTCGCGKYNDQPVLRYRLKVMVKHKDESTKFLLRDRECAELIGQSANEVNRVKIEERDVDLNASPQALDRLLGYVLTFKVKVQPKFKNVVACSKVDSPNLDCNDAPQVESLSFDRPVAKLWN
ncbi:hypothetical protein JHK82_039641 [Glycine max]|nr:hypothetical protein JHK86_039831 [Glycine max]KAG5110418.1 hypothetical protein JHK82_039641 [Glycine max]